MSMAEELNKERVEKYDRLTQAARFSHVGARRPVSFQTSSAVKLLQLCCGWIRAARVAERLEDVPLANGKLFPATAAPPSSAQ